MRNHLRIAIVSLVLAGTLGPALAPAPATAGQAAQSSLELHKYKFHIDEKGRTWVTFRFVNLGSHAVIVNAITTSAKGPWTTVGKRVEPEATFKWSGIITDRPAAVWIDTNQGVSRFDMVH